MGTPRLGDCGHWRSRPGQDCRTFVRLGFGRPEAEHDRRDLDDDPPEETVESLLSNDGVRRFKDDLSSRPFRANQNRAYFESLDRPLELYQDTRCYGALSATRPYSARRYTSLTILHRCILLAYCIGCASARHSGCESYKTRWRPIVTHWLNEPYPLARSAVA
jgi:hypothetical protein